MKSIRLSLIVYGLLLLTGAPGAVSWFAYRTTADALYGRQRESEQMITGQYKAQSHAARSDLDDHIARQARILAGLPLITAPYESVFAVNAVTAPFMATESLALSRLALWYPYSRPAVSVKENVWPTGVPYVPQLLGQELGPKRPFDFSRDVKRIYPRNTHLLLAERLVHPKEYFQTYRGENGHLMQRSESMGECRFALDNNWQKQTLFSEHYDDIELKPGVMVRRVTLKTPVAEREGQMFGGWRGPPFGGENPKGGKGGGNKNPPPTIRSEKTPTLFIQYAAELEPVEKEIQNLGEERDQKLAELNQTIHEELSSLRWTMLWVALAALSALWLGGYGVIWLGLAPLSRMSEAVSKVSPKNFHLPLEAESLPRELRPIAERLEEVLEHLQKAFAREKQAAADISHELRTPLAALMTTLEVGLKKKRSVDEYREILDECRASGQHMYQLVERLLTLARLDAGADQYHPAETDITETALSCADMIRPLAKARGLMLRLHMSDPVSTVTDPNKLREVMVNLLHNAVEYNQPNGAIDLTVERVNGDVRIEVKDTGIGITPAQMEHLFERFYRADPSRHADTPHAGLGLAIVKSYVDLMGGKVQVECGEVGTAFRVEIPYVVSIHNRSTAIQAEPVLVER